MNSKDKDDDDILRAAQEIEDYLSAHPNASDTLIGVLQWWLSQQRYVEAHGTVESALDYLVQQGKVRKHITHDGTVVYAKQQTNKEPS